MLAEALSQRRQGVQRLSRSAREYRSQDVECRRAWLLRYLGEGHSGGCAGCDVCVPDLPRPWDSVDLTLDEINASIPSTIVVLALVGDLEGHRYSRRTVELVLGGRDLKHNRHLVDHPLYGALGSMGRDGIPQVIDVLLTRGLIEERAASGEGRDYVSLCLTDEGRRML